MCVCVCACLSACVRVFINEEEPFPNGKTINDLRHILWNIKHLDQTMKLMFLMRYVIYLEVIQNAISITFMTLILLLLL